MSDYILSCSSTADLSKEHFEKRDIKYICFHFEIDGKDYMDDLGESMDFHEFYNKMADGAMTKTSQVNVDEYVTYFEEFLKEGKDILQSEFLERTAFNVYYLMIHMTFFAEPDRWFMFNYVSQTFLG